MKRSDQISLHKKIGISLIALSQFAFTEVAYAQSTSSAQAMKPAEARQNANAMAAARTKRADLFNKKKRDLNNTKSRAEFVRQIKQANEELQTVVHRRAKSKGLKTEGIRADGRSFRLIDFDENDLPVYEQDENSNAAISTATDEVRDNPIYQQASAKVEAEVAYPDNHSGIQVETTTDTGGGQNIGFIVDGDWAEYTIDVPSPGSYRLSFRTASNNNDGGTINLSSNGGSVGSIAVPDTNDWQSWTTINTNVTFATSGPQTLRMDFVGGAGSLFNINWFTYAQVSANVEAEVAYPDNHSGIQVETTTDIGGGQNIGFIVDGDWAEYTIDVPSSGSYRLSFRTASNNNDGGTIHLSADGSSIGSIVVPDTNGWQAWTTINTTVVFDTSGPQILRLDFAGGAGSLFNINWFTYSKSITIGLWEAGGVPRVTHQEFEGRVTIEDTTTTVSSHATHVAGTLAAAGIDSNVKGMAPGSSILAFNSSSDEAEMTANGASAPNTSKLYISNHSYGSGQGWEFDTVWQWRGTFSDDGDSSNDYESDFGRYSSSTAEWDGIAYNLPYYQIFISCGNQKNDNPSEGADWTHGSNTYTYDSALHPLGDGEYKNNYDNMEGKKLGKNVIAVGAVADAVTSGTRDVSKAVTTSFSSRGPADDGRIKPDIVANGASLLSSDSGSDTDTGTKSGTSMASPNACGSAALLIDYYSSRFPSQSMRASTLKGLILHTADDRGNAGPDYKYGWGLMNTQTAADVIKQHADDNGGARMLESSINDTTTTSRTHSFAWDGGSPLRVTLCWTDPPGTSKSGHENREKALVNDLNLSITGPDGTHLPYVMPHVGNWSTSSITSTATTGVNDVDNVEQVYLSSPVAGDYVVTVNYIGALTNALQDYSLIVTGQTPAEIDVEEDGAPAVTLTSDSTARDFGATAPSDTSVVHTYTVRNTGGNPLTDLALTTSGINAADFSIGSLSATELETGQATSFTVSYAPLGVGARSAALQITNNDADENPFIINLSATGLSELEAWRLEHFNSIENTGDIADDSDLDKDGILNFEEFLLATDPTEPNSEPFSFISDGTSADLTYTRSVNAMADYIFQVVWANEVTQETWSSTSVTEQILSDDGSVQEVKASIPMSTSSKRFFRIRISPK